MKSIDFTQPGGFRLTQNQLAYLQQAWTEALQGIVAGNGAGPYALSGAVITRTLSSGTIYNYSISAGWVVYQGNMIRVPASGPVAIDESVNSAYCVITPVDSTLTYNNGSTPNVLLDATVGIAGYTTGTADSSTIFLVSEMLAYGGWTTIAGLNISATGGGTATVYSTAYNRYKIVGKTLHWQFQGALTFSGTVTLLLISPNPSQTWVFKNVLGNILGGIFETAYPILTTLLATDSVWALPLGGGTYPTSGNVLIDINIIAEIV